jgi:ActR/RegA family two-component response regulator
LASEAILIVDDDPFMRDLLSESLTELEYETIPVGTGKDALHAISVNEIHLALIDLSLGDTDGLEVVDTVIDGSPDTQIIIMTGYPSIQSAIDALRRGAQDYIIKPFKMPEIHAAVARSLKNQKLEAEVRQLRRQVREQEQELLQLRTRTGGQVAGGRAPRPVGGPRPVGLPGAYGGTPPVAPTVEVAPTAETASPIADTAGPAADTPGPAADTDLNPQPPTESE